jgi:hypothetical protein
VGTTALRRGKDDDGPEAAADSYDELYTSFQSAS